MECRPPHRHRVSLPNSGGYIYRGTYFSEILGGAYVFGDTDPQK